MASTSLPVSHNEHIMHHIINHSKFRNFISSCEMVKTTQNCAKSSFSIKLPKICKEN